MQMIGIKQKRVRFPLAFIDRLTYRLGGGDVVRMRIKLGVRRDDHFRAKVIQKGTQICLQVSPGGLPVSIAR